MSSKQWIVTPAVARSEVGLAVKNRWLSLSMFAYLETFAFLPDVALPRLASLSSNAFSA